MYVCIIYLTYMCKYGICMCAHVCMWEVGHPCPCTCVEVRQWTTSGVGFTIHVVLRQGLFCYSVLCALLWALGSLLSQLPSLLRITDGHYHPWLYVGPEDLNSGAPQQKFKYFNYFFLQLNFEVSFPSWILLRLERFCPQRDYVFMRDMFIGFL